MLFLPKRAAARTLSVCFIFYIVCSKLHVTLSHPWRAAGVLYYLCCILTLSLSSRRTQVLEAVPAARLAIVGGGPFEAELRQIFAGEDVVFTGLLRGEALSRAYACADVFVMPSESETLGFVVLEATL